MSNGLPQLPRLIDPTQLPTPSGYGQLGGTQLPQITMPAAPSTSFEKQLPMPYAGQPPTTPEQADYVMQNQLATPQVIPDVLRATYGAGDPAMVKSLLQVANGQDGGLMGVPATYAAKLLQQWGYPTDMNAWDANTWQSAIQSHATDTNPLTLLSGY